jgi:murein DD-endopeptidase MepM/ murein hydrolase activator NlpD
MRLIKILALAAVIVGMSFGLPALAHSGPRLLAVSSADAPHKPGRHQNWTWPLVPPDGAVKPTILRRFEPPAKRWQSGHRGVDLLGTAGQEVVAAGAGVVSYAGVLFGRPVVAVDHTAPGRDTLRTTYEPVDAGVKVGDKVRLGQVIGHLIDSPASHCAPQACLHWGLVRGFGHAERYLDPSALLDRGPVRLLPVWGVR